MAFSTHSDPYVAVAFWTGLAALILTLVLGAQIVVMRVSLRRRERKERTIIDKWRPLLTAAALGDPAGSPPELKQGEQLVFLKLWLHLQESLRGDANAALNAIAYQLRCDIAARALLKDGRRAERLLSILVLGHLRDVAAWPVLLREAERNDSVLSIHALWALVQIDAGSAIRKLMPAVLRRQDWSLSQIVNILEEAAEECAPVLAEAIRITERRSLPRALRLAEALRIALPPGVLQKLLAHPEVDVVIAALRVAEHPALTDTARDLCAHQDWRIRVQAAKVLGRIGDRSDVPRLKTMLNDPQWWVRYRAAQALVALPFLSPAELASLGDTVTDRYAADMLKQVFAERTAAS